MVDEKRLWGEAVFAMLQKDLFGDASAIARVPVGGFLAMAIAPVLVVLAAVSTRCRLRCVEYIDAQIVLIEQTIRRAVARKSLADRAGTEQLRAFLRTHATLREALQHARAGSCAPTSHDANDIEAWMGLAASSTGPSPSGHGEPRTIE
jgi:hypothetical protein